MDQPRHRDGSAATGAKGWIGCAKGWLVAENDLLWARGIDHRVFFWHRFFSQEDCELTEVGG
uniref:Uncharacterized protein n=1 Tax=Triticum urartu TaxID=4572 RepID=A0A8R7P376_TRIUA